MAPLDKGGIWGCHVRRSRVRREVGDEMPSHTTRLPRTLLTACMAAGGLLVLLAIALLIWLGASLPGLDGRLTLAGLGRPVTVERDARGVVTLTGSSAPDLAMAAGFVHAQDRFFQMDLSRRQAAGELAALFGAVALGADRAHRLHRLRWRARQALARAPAAERELVEAYAEGVNRGLEALGAWPFEYLLLRTRPAPWLPEDSLLVSYSMFLLLTDARGDRESALALLDDTLPAGLVAFIAPDGTPWDAPLVGEARNWPVAPGPAVVDLRDDPPVPVAGVVAGGGAQPGSNNWAVSAEATGAGAILANDMHLPLRVPNVFYRLDLVRTGAGPARVTGVSLPGVPGVIAGSNGRVAWGFTNSYADVTDVVLLRTDPDDPGRYLTPDGYRAYHRRVERIEVRGGPTEELVVEETRWGPVIPPDHRGRPRALCWLGHRPGAVNLRLLALAEAGSVEEALAIAREAGMPPQNIVVADAAGRIGWTVMGRLPARAGFDPSRPADWSAPGTGWTGWLPPADYPGVMAPASGRLWTANARVVDGEALRNLGDGGYALGARAAQIRDALSALPRPGLSDMLAIQLDDRALFYAPWRDLALATLGDADKRGHPGRAAAARLLREWEPRASPGSAGFRLVYEFRARLLAELFEALTAPVREVEPGFHLEEGFRYGVGNQFGGAAWVLLETRPPHLLNPAYETWDAQVLAALDAVVAGLAGEGKLGDRDWGERNTARIRHPLSPTLSWLDRWLDMPRDPLPGAPHMPRVQTPDFGASERFAVAPGHEAEGYFHMPGGQSGHPLSPFYRAGHEDWVLGRPTPFLPGPARHRLLLAPPGG